MIKLFLAVIGTIILVTHASAAENIQLSGEEIDTAEKSPIYQKYQLVCNVCSAIEEKNGLEAALKADMKYAKKYGVINYSRRDNAVQAIKRDDRLILEGKADYAKRYKKKFSKKECELVNTEDCEGALFELSAKIIGRVPWAADDIYPK
jgi:hypothetical protein